MCPTQEPLGAPRPRLLGLPINVNALIHMTLMALTLIINVNALGLVDVH